MLTDRIIGAFTFRKGVYAEVEKDTSFTSTAWVIVAVVSLLNQLGSQATGNLFKWLIGSVVGAVFAVAGFAVAALIINWVGRSLFKAEVTFEELVRTLGLAYVWRVIGVVGVLAGFSAGLSCLLAPVSIVAFVLMVIAWFVAAKEALDLDWVQTIITVILGWIALLIVTFVAGAIMGLFGLGGAALGGALGL
jgi:hypothetical protein